MWAVWKNQVMDTYMNLIMFCGKAECEKKPVLRGSPCKDEVLFQIPEEAATDAVMRQPLWINLTMIVLS